ncbi:hypothetical protein [Desulfosarcina ovata]|uniref:Uncharacterized protein n=1 Tax=Desulfosarcina ovata subsp. ovata TaxID=2752305 RepID=A0A5K8AMV5_9BACT|nr:hypothetical protein [Desulfosarcina ovata]BBO92954.1 hypothetical protein DSCOOX_61340 [Desulfosarcina ovata subsp. ovata]
MEESIKNLEAYLQVWSDVYSIPMTTQEEGSHPDFDEIYKMAQPDGIKNATNASIEHISHCPICMKEWAKWRRAISAVAIEEDEEDRYMSYGMLEAAATEDTSESVSLQSTCGKFTLSLLPRLDDPEKGMITLEAVGSSEFDLEGQRVVLRDRKGRTLLEGKLRHGRIARNCENLTDIDLSTWTIVVGEDLPDT